MKIYNSQTKSLSEIQSDTVSIYVCGVTPYDTTHLGHAFTFIAYDVLVRFLRFTGKTVNYTQNVTDIDDDILRKSAEVGMNWQELARVETEKFLLDMKRLNWTEPDSYVRATDQVEQIIQMVKKLIKLGFAYEKNGSCYFEVKKDPEFGKRLNDFTSYDEMLLTANERGNIANDKNKKDPLDFILWQAHREGEPFWDSPWGKGRPGWHIECSVMSERYLGLPITIHGGGSDLKFPHHEAEISQSEASSGSKFVENWMHAAMVFMGGEKMSKSLGNMVFVSNLLNIYSSNVIRWYLLSHHYRKEWEYNERELEKTADLVGRFEKLVSDNKKSSSSDSEIEDLLNEDLDTPKALEVLYGLAKTDPKRARLLGRNVFGLQFNNGEEE